MHAEYEKFLHWLVERVLSWIEKHGSGEKMPQLTWPSAETLKKLTIWEVSWELPEEKYELYETYVARKGDPALNGDCVRHGPNNVLLVLLSSQGPMIWTKRKKLIQQAVQGRTVDNGNDEFCTEAVERRRGQLVDSLGIFGKCPLPPLSGPPSSAGASSSPRAIAIEQWPKAATAAVSTPKKRCQSSGGANPATRKDDDDDQGQNLFSHPSPSNLAFQFSPGSAMAPLPDTPQSPASAHSSSVRGVRGTIQKPKAS